MTTVMKHALAAAALASSAAAQAQAQDCSRQCLMDLADDYVAAMAAHDPSRVPLARRVRIVENLQRIQPGEGLWASAASVPTSFVIHVPDPVSQQIGYLAVLTEERDGSEAPIELGLRLELENGRITEAEHLVARNLSENALANLKSPRVPLVSPVIEAYRDSRSRLLAIGASYYDALDENNGALGSFADDCVRFENGMQTVRNAVSRDPSQGLGLIGSLGCEAQLDTNAFEYITHIDNRRVWIADEVTGLAFGMSQFRHAFDKHDFRVFGVPGEEMRHMDFDPFDMPAFHIFKIWGGHTHEIEAVGVVEPYMSPSGWE